MSVHVSTEPGRTRICKYRFPPIPRVYAGCQDYSDPRYDPKKYQSTWLQCQRSTGDRCVDGPRDGQTPRIAGLCEGRRSSGTEWHESTVSISFEACFSTNLPICAVRIDYGPTGADNPLICIADEAERSVCHANFKREGFTCNIPSFTNGSCCRGRGIIRFVKCDRIRRCRGRCAAR